MRTWKTVTVLPPPLQMGVIALAIVRPLLKHVQRTTGACFPRRTWTPSFITWVGVFLTVAHLVPKRLLVACELISKLGIPLTVVVTENSTRNSGQHIAGRQQIPPCAGHGNP